MSPLGLLPSLPSLSLSPLPSPLLPVPLPIPPFHPPLLFLTSPLPSFPFPTYVDPFDFVAIDEDAFCHDTRRQNHNGGNLAVKVYIFWSHSLSFSACANLSQELVFTSSVFLQSSFNFANISARVVYHPTLLLIQENNCALLIVNSMWKQ